MTVAVDSSAFGKDPLIHLDQLERWASACRRRGHALVMSEVVLLELFEHFDMAHRGFTDHLRQFNRERARHGLQPIQEPDQLSFETLQAKVGDVGVRVLPLTADDAIEAVRDQVLQRGAASKKSGHKVGAADSAWLRSVFTATKGGELLILTGDVDAVERASAQLGSSVPRVVANFPDLGRALGIEPATEAKTDEIASALEAVAERHAEELAAAVLRVLDDVPSPDETSVDLDEVTLLGAPFVLEGNFAEGSAVLAGTVTLKFDHSYESGVPWDQWEDKYRFEVETEFGFDLDGDPFFETLSFTRLYLV